MEKRIYLDHSSTTCIKEEVLETMKPFLTDKYGNASSIYLLGRESKIAIEGSRKKVAETLGCTAREIFFTASGSEANNWVLKGVAYANKDKGNHIITTKIEHHSILNTCKFLEKEGYEITYLRVDNYGTVSLEDFQNAITDKTILISIMYANNEIGTIQPIEEMAKIAKQRNIYFHTDAVQAIGSIPVTMSKSNIDMLSLSAHKFHGPKGTGALYVRNGVKIDAFIHGGSQETGKRAGTENIAGIVGLGSAIEFAAQNINKHNLKIMELRDILINGVLNNIPYTRLNGHPVKRLPGNANFSFEFVNGKSLLLMLDEKGIMVSSGSACSCGKRDASHVLLATGIPYEIAQGSLRFSFGEENTQDDVSYVLEVLPKLVSQLRNKFIR